MRAFNYLSATTFLLYLIGTLSLLSCSQPSKANRNTEKTKEKNTCPTIDLAKAIENPGAPLKMSDFVEDVEYIRPEYPASLVDRIFDVSINDKYLLLEVPGRLLCYTRDGKFLREISKKGQGPREHVGIRSSSLYNNLVAINSNFTRRGLWFDTKGNYIKTTTPIPNGVFKIDILDADRIAIHLHHGTAMNDPGLFIAGILDSKGDTIQLKKTKPYYPKGIAKSPRRWYYKDTIRVFTCLNDTVYSITKNTIQPRFVINSGKYKISKEAFADRRVLKKQRKNFIGTLTFCETKQNLLIEFPYQEKRWFVVYDKKNKQLHSWNIEPESINKYGFLRGGGWHNDVDGGLKLPAFIGVGKSGYIALRVQPFDFKEKFNPNQKAKYPKKQEKLQKLVNSLNDDENPIIILHKLKE